VTGVQTCALPIYGEYFRLVSIASTRPPFSASNHSVQAVQRTIRIGIVAAVCTISSVAHAADFSLDPASPEVPGVSSADILVAGPFFVPPPGLVPPLLVRSAGSLMLVAPDNIDAFSYGHDGPIRFTSSARIPVTFSVTRGSVGAPGSVVAAQVAGNGAAGDEFTLKVNGPGAVITLLANRLDATCPPVPPPPPPPSPIVFCPGLTPAPPAVGQSEIDSFSTFISGYASPRPTYFSFDPATAATYVVSPADILNPGPTPASVVIFASRSMLGLVAGDDIDGLAVFEGRKSTGVGTYEVTDQVFVSLTPASPTLAAIGASAADIIQINGIGGTPSVFVPAATLGLLPSDDLDALRAFPVQS